MIKRFTFATSLQVGLIFITLTGVYLLFIYFCAQSKMGRIASSIIFYSIEFNFVLDKKWLVED